MILSKLQLIGTGVAVALAVAGSSYAAHRITSNHWKVKLYEAELATTAAAEDQRAANRALAVARLEAAGLAAERDAARRQKTQIVHVETVKEVIKYAQARTDTIDMPNGFVCRYDYALSGGRVPATLSTACTPNDAPSGITDVALLSNATSNANTCRVMRDQLTALQEDITAYQEARPNE